MATRAGVDQHDHDQDRERHAVAQNEERADQNGEGTREIRDGHEGAAGEPVRERTRGQRQEEPRQPVGGDDTRDGQGVRIDEDGHQGHRPDEQSIARTGQGEPGPQLKKGTAERLPPNSMPGSATNAH